MRTFLLSFSELGALGSAKVISRDHHAGLLIALYGQMCYTLYIDEPLSWTAADSEYKAKRRQLFKPDDMVKAIAIIVRGAPRKIWAGAREINGKSYWIDGKILCLSKTIK